MKKVSNYDNVVVIRRREREGLLKSIDEDRIRDSVEGGLEIFVLVKGDGTKITQLRNELRVRGVDVRFEVVPCG